MAATLCQVWLWFLICSRIMQSCFSVCPRTTAFTKRHTFSICYCFTSVSATLDRCLTLLSPTPRPLLSSSSSTTFWPFLCFITISRSTPPLSSSSLHFYLTCIEPDRSFLLDTHISLGVCPELHIKTLTDSGLFLQFLISLQIIIFFPQHSCTLILTWRKSFF